MREDSDGAKTRRNTGKDSQVAGEDQVGMGLWKPSNPPTEA